MSRSSRCAGRRRKSSSTATFTVPADIITSAAAAGDTSHSELAKLEAACAKAMELQLAGQRDLAEQLYRAVLQAQPKHAVANYCFGMLMVQSRQPLAALPHLQSALEAKPDMSEYWIGYLEALLLADKLDEARSTLELGRRHGLAGKAVEDFAARLSVRSAGGADRASDARGQAPDEGCAQPPKAGRAQRRSESHALHKQESAL